MDMDWKAALSSEIFSEYLKTAVPDMIKKQAVEIEPKISQEEESEIVKQFEAFQEDIRNSPKKLAAFRALREKIISDDDYRAKTKKAFVDAILLLDLE